MTTDYSIQVTQEPFHADVSISDSLRSQSYQWAKTPSNPKAISFEKTDHRQIYLLNHTVNRSMLIQTIKKDGLLSKNAKKSTRLEAFAMYVLRDTVF